MSDKTAELKIRNRPFGNGISKEALVADLLEAGDLLYKCRGETRGAQTSLQDAYEGFIARIGPLATLPGELRERAKKVKDLYYEWDHMTGNVASAFEVLARDIKRAKEDPQATRYDAVKSASDHDYDRRLPNAE